MNTKLINLINAFKNNNIDTYQNIIFELKNFDIILYLNSNCSEYVDITRIDISKAYIKYIDYGDPDELLYIYILHFWNKYFLPKNKIDNHEFLFVKNIYNSVYD